MGISMGSLDTILFDLYILFLFHQCNILRFGDVFVANVYAYTRNVLL